jgi:peptide/nickel transport system ATP-binding protein
VGSAAPLLEVRALKKYFPVRKGVFRRKVGDVRAVDDVDFTVHRQETLGLVGESGCGKTTLGRTVLRLIEPSAGGILFWKNGEAIDIGRARKKEMVALRTELQIIFQDPSSLNPRMTVKDVVGEPLVYHKLVVKSALEERIAELLRQVGLNAQHMSRYTHEFSGGQRQRIGIARALALGPQLIVADEPTSALDVSVQAQVLNLLKDLQRGALSYIFISHDLSVIEHVSTRVAVMYLGRIVEIGTTAELFRSPRMPYTEALLSAITRLDPGQKMERIIPQGDVADPAQIPSGCPFHPRCRYREDRCTRERPELMPVAGSADHLAACHFADHLALRGVQPSRRRRANTAGG